MLVNRVRELRYVELVSYFSFAVKENKLTNYFYYDVIDCHLTLTHKSFSDVLLKSPNRRFE